MSDELLAKMIAAAKADTYYDTCIPDGIEEKLENPQFDNAGPIHDWRNHVHWLAKEFWEELSRGARLVIFLKAEEDASDEVYE